MRRAAFWSVLQRLATFGVPRAMFCSVLHRRLPASATHDLGAKVQTASSVSKLAKPPSCVCGGSCLRCYVPRGFPGRVCDMSHASLKLPLGFTAGRRLGLQKGEQGSTTPGGCQVSRDMMERVRGHTRATSKTEHHLSRDHVVLDQIINLRLSRSSSARPSRALID